MSDHVAPDDVELSFGEYLGDLLDKYDWTTASLADALYVDRRSVQYWLKNKRLKDLQEQHVPNIIRVLELNSDEIYLLKKSLKYTRFIQHGHKLNIDANELRKLAAISWRLIRTVILVPSHQITASDIDSPGTHRGMVAMRAYRNLRTLRKLREAQCNQSLRVDNDVFMRSVPYGDKHGRFIECEHSIDLSNGYSSGTYENFILSTRIHLLDGHNDFYILFSLDRDGLPSWADTNRSIIVSFRQDFTRVKYFDHEEYRRTRQEHQRVILPASLLATQKSVDVRLIYSLGRIQFYIDIEKVLDARCEHKRCGIDIRMQSRGMPVILLENLSVRELSQEEVGQLK